MRFKLKPSLVSNDDRSTKKKIPNKQLIIINNI